MTENIVNSMGELDEDILKEEVRKAVKNNVPSGEIISALQKGLDIVGERFESKEYFLSELMMSAELFNECCALLPEDDSLSTEKKGKFLIGTVQTDIHDIGKNIVASVMKSNGYEVVDIGVDVPVCDFVEAVRKHNPDVIGMSCLLTTAFDAMKDTVEAIRQAGLAEKKLILIGGGPVDEHALEYVKADILCSSAQQSVIESNKFLGV